MGSRNVVLKFILIGINGVSVPAKKKNNNVKGADCGNNDDDVDDDYDDVMAVAAVLVVEVVIVLTTPTPMMMMTAFICNRYFNLNSRNMGGMYFTPFETARFNQFLFFSSYFAFDKTPFIK